MADMLAAFLLGERSISMTRSPEDWISDGFFGSAGDPFALLSGAPWAVTRCFLRYHLFFTTCNVKDKDEEEEDEVD